jgi:hypothetical protein
MDLLFWAMWYTLVISAIVIIAQRNRINELKQEKDNN